MDDASDLGPEHAQQMRCQQRLRSCGFVGLSPVFCVPFPFAAAKPTQGLRFVQISGCTFDARLSCLENICCTCCARGQHWGRQGLMYFGCPPHYFRGCSCWGMQGAHLAIARGAASRIQRSALIQQAQPSMQLLLPLHVFPPLHAAAIQHCLMQQSAPACNLCATLPQSFCLVSERLCSHFCLHTESSQYAERTSRGCLADHFSHVVQVYAAHAVGHACGRRLISLLHMQAEAACRRASVPMI
jgi:hypothetical protein